MATEPATQELEQQQAAPDGTVAPAGGAEGAQPTTTPPEGAEGAPKPFQAWEQPKKEPPSVIPYSRFHEVNETAQQATRRAEAAERRLQELEAERNKAPKSPDDVKIEDFPNDPQGYLRAREAAVARQTEEGVVARLRAEREQERQREQTQQVLQAFEANVAQAAQEVPDVVKARTFLDEYAEQIHPAVAQELLTDPNAGFLLHRIATNQELLNQVFQGHPAQTIRMLHGQSALISHERSQARQPVGQPPATVPAALVPGAPPKPTPGIPMRLSAAPAASGTKEVRQMTQAEYREWRSKQA